MKMAAPTALDGLSEDTMPLRAVRVRRPTGEFARPENLRERSAQRAARADRPRRHAGTSWTPDIEAATPSAAPGPGRRRAAPGDARPGETLAAGSGRRRAGAGAGAAGGAGSAAWTVTAAPRRRDQAGVSRAGATASADTTAAAATSVLERVADADPQPFDPLAAEDDKPPTPDPDGAGARSGRGGAGPRGSGAGRRTSHRGVPSRAVRRAAQVGAVVGELLMTLGVLIALFLVYELWWTNIEAHQSQQALAHQLDQQFAQQQAGATAPPPTGYGDGQPFAYIWIPRLAQLGHPYVFVVMQGVETDKVLNKGAVGHYPESQMPGQIGNFATAAHRNGHGEPYRFINNLNPGDQVVVETAQAYYIYTIDKELPQTSPYDHAAIDPIPKGSGYTKPGQYITLTTCTPEFTSWYRMIWWGHLTQTIPWSPTRPAVLNGLTRD